MPDEGWPEGFSRGDANLRALLVLSCLRGISPRQLLVLARRFGTAAAVLSQIAAGRGASEADAKFACETDPATVFRALKDCRARFVPAGTPEYPQRLSDLSDPPAAIFVRGRPIEAKATAVAVVGARTCSALGRDVARRLSAGLAGHSVTVVSGAARGIDTAAHEGALSSQEANTIAVLGSGIDVVYPLRNRSLLDRIAARGTIVSEYAPGTPAEPFRFPARNRIIAALAEAIVIVEGGEHSGSLITTEHALDIGRSVFAVPGSVTNPLAAAPLSLIREGATMIRGASDLLDDLGLGSSAGGGLPAGLSVAERAVVEVLAGPTLPDEVSRGLGWQMSDVMPLLLQLELKGVVRSEGGRYEIRLSP